MGRIRQAALGDLDRLYEICVRTADAGDDATPLHGDPMLPGHVWAAPYLLHEPRHAFVVVGVDDVAGGYAIGALDSRRFEATLEEEWWPDLRTRYPLDAGDDERTEDDQATVHLIHHPSTAVEDIARSHPSHLHIDLLPDLQGRGLGRALVDTLLGSLADAGSPGVHLGVSGRNERAIGFYRAVGFTELGRSRHGIAFGRRPIRSS